MRRAQQGVALITVLLVVVIATVAASAMTFMQQLDIRRSGFVLDAGQAQILGDGVEVWVQQILARDDRHVDHRAEPWAMLPPALPVEGWLVGAELSDLQGRFNLNNLVLGDGKPNPLALSQLRRLLLQQQLDPELASALVDWIDPDSDVSGFLGAEDGYYLAAQPPRRAANRPFEHVSELRLVRGFDALRPEQVDSLLALLTTLPTQTPVNINTARPEVLAAMVQGLTPAAAGQWQLAGPYPSQQEALRSAVVTGLVSADERTTLAVASQYFMLRATVRRDEAASTSQRSYYAILARGADGKARVITRGEVGY